MKKFYCSFAVILLISSCLNEDIPQNATPTIDPNLCKGSTLSLSTTNSTAESGCGKTDGSITVNASGGTLPYQYSINVGAKQNSNIFSGLTGGTYSVTVYDSKPCHFILSEILVGTTGSSFAASAPTITPNSDCLTPNGSIQLSATGGATPYTYSFNSSAFSSNSLYTGLNAGTYSATIKDNSGCSVNVSSTVSKTASISYSAVIKPIIAATCAFSNCHAAGGVSVDLTNWAGANSNAGAIKSRTGSGNMPKAPRPGGDLTTEQIKQIACWVDEGALNN